MVSESSLSRLGFGQRKHMYVMSWTTHSLALLHPSGVPCWHPWHFAGSSHDSIQSHHSTNITELELSGKRFCYFVITLFIRRPLVRYCGGIRTAMMRTIALMSVFCHKYSEYHFFSSRISFSVPIRTIKAKSHINFNHHTSLSLSEVRKHYWNEKWLTLMIFRYLPWVGPSEWKDDKDELQSAGPRLSLPWFGSGSCKARVPWHAETLLCQKRCISWLGWRGRHRWQWEQNWAFFSLIFVLLSPHALIRAVTPSSRLQYQPEGPNESFVACECIGSCFVTSKHDRAVISRSTVEH